MVFAAMFLALACTTSPSPSRPISAGRAESTTIATVAATERASLPPTPTVPPNTREPTSTKPRRESSATVPTPDAQSPSAVSTPTSPVATTPTPTPTPRRVDQELRFLALGDSYTIGERVAVSERWPVQLALRLRQNGARVTDPDIVAKTGWTTRDLAAGIEARRLEGPFDIVTLMIGVNDQFRGLEIGQYRLEFLGLLQTAVVLAGGEPANVVVVSIPDWGVTPFAAGRNSELIASEIDQFNAVNREEAVKAGAAYVDVTEISRRAKTDLTLVAVDGLHPSGEMYRLWAEVILLAVTSTQTTSRSLGPTAP